MVVLWCRSCGALIGIQQPFADWTTDRKGLCPACATHMLGDPAQTPVQEEITREHKKEKTQCRQAEASVTAFPSAQSHETAIRYLTANFRSNVGQESTSRF
jgi:hypothetical protein